MLKPGSLRFLAGLCFSLVVGWYVFPFALYEKIEQPIQFSHKVHTGETGGMSCTDCHELQADGRFSGIPALEKCASCHASAIGDSPQEKQFVDEYVAKNREVPWLVYAKQPQNVYFEARRARMHGMPRRPRVVGHAPRLRAQPHQRVQPRHLGEFDHPHRTHPGPGRKNERLYGVP